MILRFASQCYFKLDTTAPLQHTLGSIWGPHKNYLKRGCQPCVCKGITSDKLEEPVDPASGKTENLSHLLNYL